MLLLKGTHSQEPRSLKFIKINRPLYLQVRASTIGALFGLWISGEEGIFKKSLLKIPKHLRRTRGRQSGGKKDIDSLTLNKLRLM